MICMLVNKGQCLRPEGMAQQSEILSSGDENTIHEDERAKLPQKNLYIFK